MKIRVNFDSYTTNNITKVSIIPKHFTNNNIEYLYKIMIIFLNTKLQQMHHIQKIYIYVFTYKHTFVLRIRSKNNSIFHRKYSKK